MYFCGQTHVYATLPHSHGSAFLSQHQLLCHGVRSKYQASATPAFLVTWLFWVIMGKTNYFLGNAKISLLAITLASCFFALLPDTKARTAFKWKGVNFYQETLAHNSVSSVTEWLSRHQAQPLDPFSISQGKNKQFSLMDIAVVGTD